MMSIQASHMKKESRTCQHCRIVKRRCDYFDDTTCARCHDKKLVCILPTLNTVAIKKRKKEDIEETLGSEVVQTKRSTSSAAVSHRPNKTTRQPPLQNQENKNLASCDLCQADNRSMKGKIDRKWLQCDNESCRLWYHVSCILVSKDPRPRKLQLTTNLDEAEFICPNCYDLTNKECAEGNRHAHSKEEIAPPSSAQVDAFQQNNDSQGVLQQEIGEIGLRRPSATGFEPAKEEKYNGIDKENVKSLIHELDQSVYYYVREILEAMVHFGNDDDADVQKPLAAWKFFDKSESIVAGQPWYCIEGPTRDQSTSHSPITASLRQMLKTPVGDPLAIDPNLRDLSFSQVHAGFVGWFVFDVLNNELGLYELPNMRPMRAMMAAVNHFGEARWPEEGRRVLREIQLRTWYKDQFQEAILTEKDKLMRKLEDYLEPLTMSLGETNRWISQWSPTRARTIECTLKLWSYLQLLGGEFEVIHPTVGSPFDPRLHEAYDEGFSRQNLEPNRKKNILWILRRGFHYHVEGLRVSTSKALVFVQ